MSVTYTEDRNDPLHEDTFVPVYARTKASRARKGGLRSWMILAPIGVLVIGGAAAAMMTMGGEDVAQAPLAEPAATAPVLPTTPAPMAMEPAPVDSAPVPVMREAAPAPAPAPVRRAAPRVQAPAPAPAATPAPRVVTPAPSPSTSTLNTAPATPAPVVSPAPTPAPAPVVSPPAIVVEPLG